MNSFTSWILGSLLFILLGLMFLAVAVDFYYFHKVSIAKTDEEAEVACRAHWYEISESARLPAKCIRFYQK